ncbi:MAG: translation elongation factor Ts [Actinobacteria bacterium]|jgi:elongation factor Ts|nr:translation elongation factor Ts [Actinomycetota bacterium]MDA8373653.1 translation elongation factor Ts [Actinomycetota bacterium]
MAVSAQDVAALRKQTGAGMMDVKRALEDAGGDMERAAQILREKGKVGAAKREDRENTQGAVTLIVDDGKVGTIVELKCETDFVAKSADFTATLDRIATAVSEKGAEAAGAFEEQLDELRVTLKEKIEVGQVVRFEAREDSIIDGYLHTQSDRGVNAVLVELVGGDRELAHSVAVHIGFTKPRYISRDEVPADDVARERETLEAISRNEGKPDAQIPKIVEGRLRAFYEQLCLLDQAYVRDEKVTIEKLLGSAKVTRFAQVVIGA